MTSQANIYGVATMTLHKASGFTLTIPAIYAQDNSVFVETKDFDLGETTREKYLDTVVFDIESLNPNQSELYVKFGYRNFLKDAVKWTPEKKIDLNNPIVKGIRTQARFMKIRLNDKSPYGQWKLSKIELYGRILQGRL